MKFIIALCVSLVTLSCANKNMSQANQENKIINLYEGNLGGAGSEGFKKENLVIQSEEDWKMFTEKLNSVNKISNYFDSKIDFSKKSAIIAVDHVRSSGGFSIKLTKANEEKESLEFNVITKGPKPTDMVASVMTQPIHIILIDKTNKKIIFVEK